MNNLWNRIKKMIHNFNKKEVQNKEINPNREIYNYMAYLARTKPLNSFTEREQLMINKCKQLGITIYENKNVVKLLVLHSEIKRMIQGVLRTAAGANKKQDVFKLSESIIYDMYCWRVDRAKKYKNVNIWADLVECYSGIMNKGDMENRFSSVRESLIDQYR